MNVFERLVDGLMGVVEGTVLMSTHKTTVLCPPKCRDILQALQKVPNGAELVETHIGDGRVKLVFELDGKREEI